jgi:HEAT repeat protein
MSSRDEQQRRERGTIPTLLIFFAVAALVGLPLVTELGSRRSGEAEWLAGFQDVQPDARAIAAFEAARGEPAGPSVLRELARLLADSSDDVRREAVAALIRIGRRSDESATTVTALTDSVLFDTRDASVRLEAMQVLGALGPRGVTASLTLSRALDDPMPELRAAAVSALGRIRVSNPAIVNRVTVMLRDSAADVRAASLEAIAQLRDDEEGIMLLADAALHDSSAFVRLAAVYALSGSAAPRGLVATTLTAAQRDPSSEVRDAADRALRRLR